MINKLRKGFALGLGLAVTSKEQAEKSLNELVKKGELSQQESKDFLYGLWKKGEETQKEIDQVVQNRIKHLLNEANLVTKEDINELEERLNKLEMEKNNT
ncbi:polyhydroxyalkanoate synthesis regulator [Priestia flexa]|uniref:phasin family protein n=1 Tax=Priestia flexa TaxID=86664 RepID=UPI001EF4D24E|nr:polyhydroxyalkanoate synthesis regulator [Priestia flexa]MCG7314805.1 polyhydroxyalkanoate synthesis regulator [Priestia flexa]